jgi:hypothetical protein
LTKLSTCAATPLEVATGFGDGLGDGFGVLVVRGAGVFGDGAAFTGVGAATRAVARGGVVRRAGVLGFGAAVGPVVVGTARVGAVVVASAVEVVLDGLDVGVVAGGAATGELLSRPNAMTAPALTARRAATATTPRSRCRALVGTARCRAMSYLANRPFGSDGPTPYARWAMTTTFRVVCSSRPVAR